MMTDVQVQLELGHRASVRPKATNGFTHEWTVYVRGQEQYNLSMFIEKVVFHLHPSFDNPKRVIKEPPYQVSELGYAGFELRIEIYFRNKEPRKCIFTYYLFLNNEIISYHTRCEKITFQNPTEEFKKKLLKAGGVEIIPNEESQFNSLFGPPINTTESPKKVKPAASSTTLPAKDKPARPSLDDKSSGVSTNNTTSSSRSKEKSSSSSKSSTQSVKSESSREHEGYSSKGRSGKERHSSKDSLSSRKHTDIPIPSSKRPPESQIPLTKRPPESPNRHHDPNSKKLKRSSSSSSFPEKRTKDIDKDKQREERDRQKEQEREKEREKEREREKAREREAEREKEKRIEIEKEKARQKEKEREKEKYRNEKKKEKTKESYKKSTGGDKYSNKDNDCVEIKKEKSPFTGIKKEKSPFTDTKKEKSPQLETKKKSDKCKDSSGRKSVSPKDAPRVEDRKKSTETSTTPRDTHTDRHTPTDGHTDRHTHKKSHKDKTQGADKLDNKHKEDKVKHKSSDVVKHVDKKRVTEPEHVSKSSRLSESSHKHSAHKQLLNKISSRELKDDLSLSDSDSSDDSSVVSSLSSSSADTRKGHHSGSGSDSVSEAETRASMTSPPHTLSSAASSPIKSGLGKLIDQLDEEESDDDIAEPSSVFSNHSAVSSRASPSHQRHAVPPMFSPDYHTADHKSKPDRKPSKGRKAHRKGDGSVERSDKCHELLHSDSKGFSLDRSDEALPPSNRTSSGINIGDEAPIGVLESPNGEDLTELVALQRQLMTLKDPTVLVKVVMLIQEVEKFKIGDSTFDFDLCSLDRSTVQQIRTYLSQD